VEAYKEQGERMKQGRADDLEILDDNR